MWAVENPGWGRGKMTVGELLEILDQVEKDRLVYVPGSDGPELIQAIVDVKDREPIPGVKEEAGVALMTAEQYEELTDDDEES